MEQWYRQNKVFLPWALLGLEVAVSIGLRLYKIQSGIEQDIQNIDSPTETLLPKLSEAEIAELPYPPDAYPGARDVSSPYGSLRVYEWGPEDGKKVLLVHGITNPCIALGGIAQGLVDKGCRVIMFDLPGKGYSSTPSTPHSARLFTTCILLALTSSPISWTGHGSTFSLIGYSLGGGIAANFYSYFLSLVSSLVLLAPAGLVRKEKITLLNRFLYNTGLVPETTLEAIVKKRLQRGDPPVKTKKVSPSAPVTGEMLKQSPETLPRTPILSRMRPGVTTAKVIPWQIEAHQGFVKSFMSSLRYGPIVDQHSDWRKIGERLTAQNVSHDEKHATEGLQNGKVLIIAGTTDAIIVREELVPDATETLGAENVKFEFFEAGHELPVTKSEEIVDCVFKFWQGE